MRIIVLGSSTATGYGLSDLDLSWVGRYRIYIQQIDLKNEIINLAVDGNSTYDIMPSDYIPPSNRPYPDEEHNITKAISYNPQAIIINLPTNDVGYGYSTSEQMNNYRLIMNDAAKKGILVWITTSQPRNFDLSKRLQLKELKDSIAIFFKDKSIDFWSTLALSDGSINSIYDQRDGIHLNTLGHKILYQRVVNSGLLGKLEQNGLESTCNSKRFVFPNPFRNFVFIDWDVPVRELVVVDMFGRIIRRWDEPADEIDLSFLPQGIYVIRIIDSANEVINQCVMKLKN